MFKYKHIRIKLYTVSDSFNIYYTYIVYKSIGIKTNVRFATYLLLLRSIGMKTNI